jgi:hypothetical protein
VLSSHAIGGAGCCVSKLVGVMIFAWTWKSKEMKLLNGALSWLKSPERMVLSLAHLVTSRSTAFFRASSAVRTLPFLPSTVWMLRSASVMGPVLPGAVRLTMTSWNCSHVLYFDVELGKIGTALLVDTLSARHGGGLKSDHEEKIIRQ